MAKAVKTAAPSDAIAAGVADYIVTDKAPEKVAGRRVQKGDRLTLTDEQALFEEMSGHIAKVPTPAPKAD